ncbi:minor tail protein [Streptomyces phage Celia]|uniref:Minor tail protein n=1 Tax=Streptomyces phage Celia TaxID=2590946 RepID=A0A516KRF7_9CAUD|nr:minor tail protein [Streptomyces phage Celia]QDP44223.1 minor tail protein [Streptomyces phage Celia]QFG10483.1 minor tail protein [Streptomyces phage Urza]QJD50585.1 minor tail protein [Streptomyces phage Itza]
MKLSELTVEVRNKSLARIGVVRPEELILEVQDEFNNVGTWKLTLAIEHPLAAVLRTPGSGVIITGPTDVLMSGPTIKNEYASTPEDPGGSIVFEGISDTHILADYLALPDPSNTNPTTQTLSHDVRTGHAEDVMHAYVNANVGPGAPSDRRNANLAMGTSEGRGALITKSARFPVLGNLLSEIAVTPGLGFRIVQRDDELVFETSAVTDRSAYIRLDVWNNTLSGSRVAIGAPSATRVIVAGQGEQEDRNFRLVTTDESLAAETEWGRRIEVYKDQRNTNDDGELDDSGAEILEKQGFTSVAAQAVPNEDSPMQFGKDWSMGDKVSVIVNDQQLTATVTGMILRADENGFQIGAVLGDPTGFNPEAATSARVQNTENRVSELERNGSTGGGGASDDVKILTLMGVW